METFVSLNQTGIYSHRESSNKSTTGGVCMKRMSTFITLLSAVLLTFAGAASAYAAETQAFVYIANEGGNISKVGAATHRLEATLSTNGSVHNVQISPDGQLVGATVTPAAHGHEAEKTPGFALFFDTSTDKLLQSVTVGNHPAHIVFTPDNRYALVTNSADGNMSVIDLATYSVVKSITTGKGPHGFRVSSDGKFAYIANLSEDTVSVIDLTHFTELRKIKIGSAPVTTGITSNGQRLLATLNTENTLAIVNMADGTTKTIAVGTGPAQVYISPDDRYAFVANQGTKQNPSITISKIDLASNAVVSTIETGKGAHGVVTSPDGRYVYVTNMYDDTVSIIDNISNKVIETITVGKAPNGITYKR